MKMDTTSRLRGDLKYYVVSQTQLASAVGLSVMRINQLIGEGIVIRDPLSRTGEVMLLESLKNFYQSRKTTDEDGLNYTVERARLTKAKRELAELKLGRAKGELLEAKKVEESLTALFRVISQKLLSMPSKMGRQLSGKAELEIKQLLSEEIGYALEELSNYDVGELKTEVAIYDED